MAEENMTLIELLFRQFTHSPVMRVLIIIAVILILGIIVDLLVWKKTQVIPFIEILQYFGLTVYVICTILLLSLPLPLQIEPKDPLNPLTWPSEFVRSILEWSSLFSLTFIVIIGIGGIGSIIWLRRNSIKLGKSLVFIKVAITILVFSQFAAWLFFVKYLLER